MERFVFVAAVTIAIIWGVVAMASGGRFFHWDLDIDDADARLAPLVEVAPGSMAAQTYVGDELDLEDLAANVVITTEDRADYVIEIANPAGRAPMPEVTVRAATSPSMAISAAASSAAPMAARSCVTMVRSPPKNCRASPSAPRAPSMSIAAAPGRSKSARPSP